MKYSERLRGADVAGTTLDGLYETAAYGVTGFRTQVPAPGTYQVRLLTVENYWNAPGKRVFDVAAEGLPLRSGIDIFAAVGRGHAYDIVFPVRVTDGRIDLSFTASADHAIVSAIEVKGISADVSDLPTSQEAPVTKPTPDTAAFA